MRIWLLREENLDEGRVLAAYASEKEALKDKEALEAANENPDITYKIGSGPVQRKALGVETVLRAHVSLKETPEEAQLRKIFALTDEPDEVSYRKTSRLVDGARPAAPSLKIKEDENSVTVWGTDLELVQKTAEAALEEKIRKNST